MPSSRQRVVEFGDCLTISDVGNQLKDITRNTDEYDELILDADSVEIIDGAGVQFLAEIFSEAKHNSSRVTWRSISEPVKDAVFVSGLSQELSLSDS